MRADDLCTEIVTKYTKWYTKWLDWLQDSNNNDILFSYISIALHLFVTIPVTSYCCVRCFS